MWISEVSGIRAEFIYKICDSFLSGISPTPLLSSSFGCPEISPLLLQGSDKTLGFCLFVFFKYKFIYLFVCFWLHWVFVAVCGLSLVA